MKCHEQDPLSLLLDIKSRHVPKRIWALVVDALRDAGMRVAGLGSFMIPEIRNITQYCREPLNEYLFFHSAGDLQKACRDGMLRQGDRIFFNAGSLFWNWKIDDSGDIASGGNSVVDKLWNIADTTASFFKPFDVEKAKDEYRFQSYARIAARSTNVENKSTIEQQQMLKFGNGKGSTIEDYKNHFDLSIGLYVQEFAIDERAIDMIATYVNHNPHVYNLGLGWGGINGVTICGIKPGRFLNTDGFWNQRYCGERWHAEEFPATS